MQGHRLIQSLVLASILTPTTAWSFTMTTIQVYSGLNQKLEADIPIHLGAHEKPSDISVRMAAPIFFEKHKISRHSLLDKIEFKRIGTAIQITSNSPINVPTLDFLLEINSRKGRSYQRYNIVFNKNPADNKTTTKAIEASTLIPVALNAGIKPEALPVSSLDDRLNKDNTFGPTKKSDSLAKIAKYIAKLRGVNTKTAITALRHDNPKAFYKGKHGRLKTGEFLQISGLETAKPVEETGTASTSPLSSTPLANDINTQQLQSKVEKLEHHVEQIQKEITALQTQASINSAVTAKPKVETETKTAPTPVAPVKPKVDTEAKTTPASPVAPIEPKVETAAKTIPVTPVEPKVETETKTAPASPVAPVESKEKSPIVPIISNGHKVENDVTITPLSPIAAIELKEVASPTLAPEKNNPKPTTATTPSINNPLVNVNYLWLLGGALALGLLAWLTTWIVKKRRVMATKSASKKTNTNQLDDLDLDLDLEFDSPIPKKASSAAAMSNMPSDSDENQDDFDFDFLKSQVNTTKMKKLKRPSRYPADINDNLKK